MFIFRKRIIENLKLLEDEEKCQELGVNSKNLSKSQKLRLCVYLIEKEYHFTGEGVFLDLPFEEYDDNELVEIENMCQNIFRRGSSR